MTTLTVTVPDPQVPRIQTAMGAHLRLGRDATAEEVRQQLVDYLKGVVFHEEASAASDTARDAVTVVDAT